MTSLRAPSLVAALLPFGLFSHAGAQACPDAGPLTRGYSGVMADVRYLADDALGGRLAGSPGERCAGDYLAGRMRQLGLEGGAADGSFFQDVPLASAANPHAPGGTGRNVIGVLRGTGGGTDVIVIGAHYDHLGHGGFGSLAPDDSAVHNGADDNASGVAALLRAATLLASGPRPARDVVFVAFTGEESGLLGSTHFVRDGGIEPRRMRAMLNMDMVGRLGSAPLIVYGVDTATEWRAMLDRNRDGLELALQGDGYGPSDHTSFYMNDVPVLHFFTNTHGDYHRPTDDWDRVDAPGVERVAALVAGLARELGGSNVALTLQQGAGRPQQTSGGGYGAWLGTVPDFTPVERGVLLGGVTAGSPGADAGLRAGDILIGLGGKEVVDLQGFTDALRSHRPGDTVEVVVLREGRELRLRALLGRRGR